MSKCQSSFLFQLLHVPSPATCPTFRCPLLVDGDLFLPSGQSLPPTDSFHFVAACSRISQLQTLLKQAQQSLVWMEMIPAFTRCSTFNKLFFQCSTPTHFHSSSLIPPGNLCRGTLSSPSRLLPDRRFRYHKQVLSQICLYLFIFHSLPLVSFPQTRISSLSSARCCLTFPAS